ncbi:MAG: DUF3987 domain-containing protein [Candidatus Omnitrophica bacterium]|nr:DUF3987 domain-containing protein [Candidatus Omnitrophota bacterium]
MTNDISSIPETLETARNVAGRVIASYKDDKRYFSVNYLPDGFLKDYVNFAEPLTEAPIQYHIATALSLVATCLGRSVYLSEGATEYYPNLYVLVIGESGITRKSTATGLAKRFLSNIDSSLVLGALGSKEAFLEAFRNNYCHLIIFDELKQLLDNAEKSYGTGIITDFTMLWSCPPSHRFEFKSMDEKEREIKDPTLNILSCTTPDWLMIKEHDIGGGFLGRFLPIFSTKPVKRMPIRPKMDSGEFERLISELKRIREIKGEYVWTEEAQRLFEGLYNELMDGLEKEEEKTKLQPYWSRIDTHIRKLAMIFDVCSPQPTFTITKDNLMRAFGMMELITEYYKEMLGCISYSFVDKKEKQFINILESVGVQGIDHSRALQNLHIDAKLMQGLVATLIEKELIVLNTEKQPGDRKAVKRYYAKQYADLLVIEGEQANS